MANSLTALLPAVIEIAERAGRTILEIYNRDFGTAIKPDGTLVTEADLNSEAVILSARSSIVANISSFRPS